MNNSIISPRVRHALLYKIMQYYVHKSDGNDEIQCYEIRNQLKKSIIQR